MTGKGMSFGAVKQYQNASDNGLDILAQIEKVDPPPPPDVGDFVAFGVKSTLGAADNPPGLSAAQRDPGRKGGFVETRLTDAYEGKGSYPELPDDEIRFIRSALRAQEEGKMQFRKTDIRMDHSGSLASTGGKPSMEIKLWQ